MISPIIKTAVLHFYSEVFVNAKPFESMLQHPIQCFSYDRAKSLVLTERAWPMLQGNKKHPSADSETERKMREFELQALHVVADAFVNLPKLLMEGNRAPYGSTVVELSALEGQSVTKIKQACIKNLEASNSEVIAVLHYQRAVIELLSNLLEFGIASSALIKLSIEISGVALKLKLSPQSDLTGASGLFFLAYARSRKSTKMAHSRVIESALENLMKVSKMRRLYALCANIKLWHSLKDSLLSGMTEEEMLDNSLRDEYKSIYDQIFSIFSLQSHPDFSKINTSSGLNAAIGSMFNIIFNLDTHIGQENEWLAAHESDGLEEERSFTFIDRMDIPQYKIELSQLGFQRLHVDIILLETLHSVTSVDSRTSQTASSVSKIFNARQDLENLEMELLEGKLQSTLVSLLMDFYSQRHSLYEQLCNVEFYNGLEENKVYETLTQPNQLVGGTSYSPRQGRVGGHFQFPARFAVPERLPTDQEDSATPNKISSPTHVMKTSICFVDLQKYVDKMLFELSVGVTQDASAAIQAGITSNLLLESVQGCASLLLEKLDSKLMFKKTQNLMRNLKFHQIIFRLVNSLPEPAEHPDVIQACLDFLELFCLFNQRNQEAMLDWIWLFLDLIPKGFDCSGILGSFMNSLMAEDKTNSIIEYIFKSVRRIISSEQVSTFLNLQRGLIQKDSFTPTKKVARMLESVIVYLKVLNFFSVNELGVQRTEIQSLTLLSIIKSPEIAKLYDFSFLDLVRKVGQLKSSQTELLNPDDMALFDFYSGWMGLAGELCKGSQTSLAQVRRILDADAIQEKLLGGQFPFLLKKQLLKWFQFVSSCST